MVSDKSRSYSTLFVFLGLVGNSVDENLIIAQLGYYQILKRDSSVEHSQEVIQNTADKMAS